MTETDNISRENNNPIMNSVYKDSFFRYSQSLDESSAIKNYKMSLINFRKGSAKSFHDMRPPESISIQKKNDDSLPEPVNSDPWLIPTKENLDKLNSSDDCHRDMIMHRFNCANRMGNKEQLNIFSKLVKHQKQKAEMEYPDCKSDVGVVSATVPSDTNLLSNPSDLWHGLTLINGESIVLPSRRRRRNKKPKKSNKNKKRGIVSYDDLDEKSKTKHVRRLLARSRGVILPNI